VVDSAAVSSAAGLTEAAEYLHEVLLLLQKKHTQGKTSKTQAMPVLLAANKQDVFTSLPVGLVRAKLEDEITKVRLTRSKGLMDSGVGMEDDVGGVDEEQNWLGEFGSVKFKFAQMEEHGVEVKVAGGNVKGDGDDAGKVGEWWAWVGDNL
jgi:signal recognition particle receptor subunit beta